MHYCVCGVSLILITCSDPGYITLLHSMSTNFHILQFFHIIHKINYSVAVGDALTVEFVFFKSKEGLIN